MTRGLNSEQTRFVTYLVYVLLAVLTIVISWQSFSISGVQAKVDKMPETYVRIERYKCDQEKIDKKLDKIIDTLIKGP